MLLNLYKPKCQDYHEERFDEYDFKWKLIYMIPHVATYETKKPVFFSINSLKMYYILIKSYFILVQSPSLHAPSVSYLMNHRSIFFYECTNGQNLSPSIISFRKSYIISFSKKSIFGFTDVLDNNYLLVNHLLLIFKYNVCNLKVSNTLSFQSLKRLISQIKYLEETTIENDLNKK